MCYIKLSFSTIYATFSNINSQPIISFKFKFKVGIQIDGHQVLNGNKINKIK